MYRILKALKDTYITNKIISEAFRATDANVGQAGTLDLFKLYDENFISGTTAPTELTRLLIKFDLSPLQKLTGSTLDYTHSSFKCTLKMHDIYGGQICPTNFKIIVFPVSQSFDEGVGMDVKSYGDLDSCNYVTASVSNDTPTLWNTAGANAAGLLGSSNIDIIASGNLNDGNGVANLWKSQTFKTGIEDLSIDVTTIVSATLAGQLPDHGLRISFSGSHETDTRSRFIKRFASRHSQNDRIIPKILVQYDDSIHDDHASFFFDLSGSLFLKNYHRGKLSNIISGSSAVSVTGSNCLKLKLKSGSFSKTINISQHQIGSNYVSGTYSGSFAIAAVETKLSGEIQAAGSGTFKTYWISNDTTYAYHTGSLVVKEITRDSFNMTPKRLSVNITNQKNSYLLTEKVRFRMHVTDVDPVVVRPRKVPRAAKSLVFREMFYRIRDANSNDVLVPFDTDNKSTRLSSDAEGMYYDLYMDSLTKGRSYTFDFLIKDRDSDLMFRDIGLKFRVD